MGMASVIGVCLLLTSMIYFLLTLSCLSKRAEKVNKEKEKHHVIMGGLIFFPLFICA